MGSEHKTTWPGWTRSPPTPDAESLRVLLTQAEERCATEYERGLLDAKEARIVAAADIVEGHVEAMNHDCVVCQARTLHHNRRYDYELGEETMALLAMLTGDAPLGQVMADLCGPHRWRIRRTAHEIQRLEGA